MKSHKEMIVVMQGYDDGRAVRYVGVVDPTQSGVIGPSAHIAWNWRDYDYNLEPREVTVFALYTKGGNFIDVFTFYELALESARRIGAVVVPCKGQLP